MEKSPENMKNLNGYYFNDRLDMLKYIPDTAVRILEVGCGAGIFCSALKQRSDREVWGVEINPEAGEKARAICDRIFVGDFNDFFEELPKNYFDCVVFNDVLEHIYAPWDTLRMVKSLLSDTGLVVSSIPNFRYIDNLITEIVWRKDFRYKPEGGILDDTHIRFFTYKSAARMYQEQGYELVIHECIRPCKSWKEKLFINLTFGILSDARYKHIATVAKPARQ
ncbi:MAG: class I SAM-dependent methyltransferase [Paludibacter sp.]|nr:class I SAM-dependent methyltransferase [Paludibacter sp.]